MSFSADLNRFTQKFDQHSDRFVSAVEMKLFSAVIKDSPVDTGRFRGNWQASTGSAAVGEVETTDPSGNQTISAMQSLVTSLRGGRVTFLTNNLPYAMNLEMGMPGGSSQAPNGMVRKNVARFQRLVDAEARKHQL